MHFTFRGCAILCIFASEHAHPAPYTVWYAVCESCADVFPPRTCTGRVSKFVRALLLIVFVACSLSKLVHEEEFRGPTVHFFLHFFCSMFSYQV